MANRKRAKGQTIIDTTQKTKLNPGRLWYSYHKKSLEIPNSKSQNNTMLKKDNRTSNELQNITKKTKDRATRAALIKRGGVVNSGAPSSCSISHTILVLLLLHLHIFYQLLTFLPLFEIDKMTDLQTQVPLKAFPIF